MRTKYGIVAIIMVLTLFLSMPMLLLPTTVKADPTILTVGTSGEYQTISAAIAAASPGDTILVSAGTYYETLQITTNALNITAVGDAIVEGGAMFDTHYGDRQATIFVTGASNVVLNGLDVEGSGLGIPDGTKSYAVLYESSTGTVQGCVVSPNTVGDMSSTAIAAWDNSIVTIQGCTVENFGRIGIYANNATLNIIGNTIIGQLYTSSSLVNYGIEIEDYTGFSIATITNNNIYDCGNPSSPPDWSSAGVIVDVWRYYDAGSLQPSIVHIEYNNIHDNFEAIEFVGNALSYAHYNNIYGNQWGVWTDTDENDNPTYLDAQYNWWGSPTGPGPNDADPTYVNIANYLTGQYAPQLYIAVTPINKNPSDVGKQFTVSVTLSDFANLMGFDIQLTWDNSLISFVSADKTPLSALWPTWNSAFENSGAGFYELAASSISTAASNSGASVLYTVTFKILKSSNFPLSTPIYFTVVKLSDNATPVPNPIFVTAANGLYTMNGASPDLEFTVLKWDKGTSAWDPTSAPYQFVYGTKFEVQVSVTDISANSPLQDYDVKISFANTLASFVDVDAWGIFGTGTVDTSVANVVDVSGSSVTGWSGTTVLLFTLKFEVQFALEADHIWKYGSQNYLTFTIGVADATLSFGSLGSIGYSGITKPTALTIEVDFIRGDVECLGTVTSADIGDVAYYYGQPASVKPEYDLNNDGIIDIYDIVTIATNYGFGM